MNENKNKVKIKLTKIFTAPLFVLASIILIAGCTNLEKMPPTGKPFVSITADKTYGEAPLNVSFTITAIPARGSIKKLVIDYGDGSSEDLTQKLKEDKVSISHEFKTIGTFRVRVAAMDQNGSSEAEIQITTDLEKIPPTGKPFVSITADKTYGEAPLNVLFTITAIPARGSIKKLVIDYGDGSSEDLTQKLAEDKVSVSHEFKAIGTFRVRVAAMDQNGSAEAEMEITTNDKPIISNLKAYKVIYFPSYSEIVTNEFMPGDNVRIRALCIDQNPPFYGLIDWGDGSVDQIFGECLGIHTYSTEGDYTIRLIVQDSAPQPLSNTASITVKVRYVITPTNRPPELDISLSSTSGEAPFSVTLYVGVVDIDGSVSEVKVDWGDGQVENIGDADKIGEIGGKKLYRKSHTYTSQGIFTVTVIAKDDKEGISTKEETVTVYPLKPILSVRFKDHVNQDPNNKTYDIDMTLDLDQAQVIILTDILAYDFSYYDLIAVIRKDYADGSTRILVGPITPYRIGVFSLENYIINDPDDSLRISPFDILLSPMDSYPDGITVDYTVKIYAVRSGVAGIWWWSNCYYNGFFNGLPYCEGRINTIENHPSSVYSERKFKVRPSP
jgi:PKD repeat protein